VKELALRLSLDGSGRVAPGRRACRKTAAALLTIVGLALAAEAEGQVVPIGLEFQISQQAAFENSPAVAAAGTGSLLTVWRRTMVDGERGVGEPLMARLLDDAGNPTVDEFEITGRGRGVAAVAAGPAGQFLVVWNTKHDVWAQEIAPEGRIEREAVRLTESSPDEIFNDGGRGLAVSFLADGRAVVAWQTQTKRVGVRRVEARLLRKNGRPMGKRIPVSVPGLGGFWPRGVDVVALADGGFVVVWDEMAISRNGKHLSNILGRVFSDAGRAQGDPFQLSENGGVAELPSIAALAEGGFIAAWSWRRSNRHQAIHSRRYRSSLRAGKVQLVTTPGAWFVGPPQIAVSGEGLPMLVWHELAERRDDSGLDVMARSLTKKGRVRKALTPMQINASTVEGQQHDPTIAHTSDGSLVAVWQDEHAIGGRTIVGRFLAGKP